MLEIRHLRKSFGATPVLHGIDLEIATGEFFALLGPSGCGKSTLLRILAGFEQADAGQVSLDGRRIDLDPPHRRSCHMIFQRYALFPHLDVARNVAFALELKGCSRRDIAKRVSEALALVEMTGFEKRRIQTLSGGQQQRVAIARAVIDRPQFLLLDEPLAALDLKLRQRMQHELRLLQRQLGLTFIFVTHDQEEALSLADRVTVMNHGRVMQCASPRDLYENPASAFVASFVGRVNQCSGRVVRADDTSLVLDVAGLGQLRGRRGQGCTAREGAAAHILIRPEQLLLTPTAASSDQTTLPCIVQDVIFKGPHIEVVLAPVGRPDLRLFAWHALHSENLPIPGAQIPLQWPDRAAIVFEEGAAS